jgi:hypothetical protein
MSSFGKHVRAILPAKIRGWQAMKPAANPFPIF